MQNEISSLLQQVTGGQADTQAVGQAANDHLSNMQPADVQQHLQTAADNAQANGQTDVASTIRNLLEQHGGSNAIVGAAASLIQNNPQILQHFAPDFARGLLNRL